MPANFGTAEAPNAGTSADRAVEQNDGKAVELLVARLTDDRVDDLEARMSREPCGDFTTQLAAFVCLGGRENLDARVVTRPRPITGVGQRGARRARRRSLRRRRSASRCLRLRLTEGCS